MNPESVKLWGLLALVAIGALIAWKVWSAAQHERRRKARRPLTPPLTDYLADTLAPESVLPSSALDESKAQRAEPTWDEVAHAHDVPGLLRQTQQHFLLLHACWKSGEWEKIEPLLGPVMRERLLAQWAHREAAVEDLRDVQAELLSFQETEQDWLSAIEIRGSLAAQPVESAGLQDELAAELAPAQSFKVVWHLSRGKAQPDAPWLLDEVRAA